MWALDLGRGSRLRRGNVQEVFRSGRAVLLSLQRTILDVLHVMLRVPYTARC
jgi:hypothetical protein